MRVERSKTTCNTGLHWGLYASCKVYFWSKFSIASLLCVYGCTVCLCSVYTVCLCGVVWMKVIPYCFTLAGCQNTPLPVVDQGWLTAAMKRKHLTSSLTEDVCVCVYPLEHPCIFMLAYTEADVNEDVRQLYNWADVCALIWFSAAHWRVVIH